MRIWNHKKVKSPYDVVRVTGEWEPAQWQAKDRNVLRALLRKHRDTCKTTNVKSWGPKFLAELHEEHRKVWKKFYFFAQDRRAKMSLTQHLNMALASSWCTVCSEQWMRSDKAGHCEKCKHFRPEEAKKAFAEAMKRAQPQGKQLERKLAKTKATCLERFGVMASSQNAEVKAKVRKTNLRRRGCEYPTQSTEVMRKQRATNIRRYGSACYLASEKGQQHVRATNQSKRGVDYPTQDPKVMAKVLKQSLHLHKIVIDGKRYTVQAKAELALVRKLVAKHGRKNVHSQFGKRFPADYAEEVCGYVPDFYVESHDVFVECKSPWTLLEQRGQLEKNKAKARRAGEQLIWVVHTPKKDTEFVQLPDGWYKWSVRKLQRYLG